MHKNLYSILDTISEVFNNPFTEINDDSAKRTFFQSLAEVPHKTDYALYSIGAYNDNDGTLYPLKVPIKITTGFEYKSNISSITPEMQLDDLKHTG